MTPLWDSASLRAATGGTVPDGVVVTGVSIDTRAIAPGDLFVALRDARDGHDFVAAAFAGGASCALVDRDVEGGPALRVADTLRGLTDLGAAGRARAAARVVAVTGSVGKTSTKEMLAAGLAACGATHASAASFNNHWGVPVTLARLPASTAYAVIEVGMNTRGEIAPLSRLARPHVVMITTIAPAHLGRLGSMEAIAEEKADILAGLEPGGTAVFPADNDWSPLLRRRAEAAGARLLTFGEAPDADADADARMADWHGDAESQSFRALLPGGDLRVTLPVPGRHMGTNALGAILAARALGADPARFAEGLATFSALAGRGARVTLALPDGEATLLDESYNANTASIRAALAVLAAQPARRRVAVLGDMLELGDDAPAMHAALAPDVARTADLVFTCGPEMRRLHDALPANKRGTHAPDSAALAPIVSAALRPGDVVLVKGSLGSRMALVVRAIRSVQGAAA